MIFDHHGKGKTTIKDAFLIQDDKVSSTCERITNLIEAYDIEIDPYYATILLSGSSKNLSIEFAASARILSQSFIT